jgi:predicted Fe-Mo cluster-binding NifX family protein
MKIAVASADGKMLSSHFGRSACFVVFDVADGKIVSKEERTNSLTAFGKGECAGPDHHHHDGPHSHADVVNALSDCEVLLCGGMGRRAAEELEARGIRPLIVETDLPADKAVTAYLSGSLKTAGTFCACSHH